MLTRTAAVLAPRIARPAPTARGVIVAGELTRASGLGECARLMLRALQISGVPTGALDIGAKLPAHADDLPPWPETILADAALVLHVNAPLLPLVLARLPRGLTRGRRIVGFWAWELPCVSAEWRVGARFVHDVWAPSQFTADALARLGPSVRTVPPPLAVAPPRPAPLDRAAFGLPADAVVTLVGFNLASSFVRKNPLGAVAAFRAAFGDRRDRLLLLKVGNPSHAPRDMAILAAAIDGAPNIRVETRTMPPAEAHALTAAADIILSLHRSEGFGLVPAEAMLLGRPVIATGWSGNMTFMDQDCAALVGYRLVPARDRRGVYAIAGAEWAEPDLDQASASLRRLADAPELRDPARRGGACGGAVAARRGASRRGGTRARRSDPGMRVLVWQWGRRGAGPRIAAALARGLDGLPDTEALLALSAGAEILCAPDAPRCDLPLPLYRGLVGLAGRALQAPRFVGAAARWLRATRPVLAICAMPGPLDLLMVAALRRAEIPFVVVAHDARSHPGDRVPGLAAP